MTGSDFYNSSALRCFFGNTSVPVLFIDSSRVLCTIFPVIPGTFEMIVANDGFQGDNAQVQVLGSCDALKPGSIVSSSLTSCECPRGAFDTGSYCQLCPDASYQTLKGQSQCTPCDASRNTRGAIGSTDASACVCKDGFYARVTECHVCAAGMVCLNGTLSVAKGFWRSLPESFDFIPCDIAVGGDRCTGGMGSGDELCGVGYEGPVCKVCSSGFGNIGPSQCVRCTGKGSDGVTVFVIFILWCVGIVVLVKLTTAKAEDNGRGSVGSVIKICLNFMQIMFYIGTLAAEWSPGTITFFNLFLPMSISPSFISVKCVSDIDFYSRTTLVMLLPLILCTALLILMVVVDFAFPRKWLQSNFVINRYTYMMTLVVILYTIHPMIASSTFSVLNCTKVPGLGGGSYLTSDMTVDCSSEEYKRFRAGVCVFIALYVFGGPLYTMRRMDKNYLGIRDVLLYNSSPSKDSAFRYVYLVRGYKPGTFMWEGVVLFRKLAIVGIAALVSGGLQMAWCGVVLWFSMVITVQRQPFSTVLDNRIEILAHAALIFSVLLAFHSFFLPDSGNTILGFLVVVNCSVIAVMVFAFFKRFRPILYDAITKLSNLISFDASPLSMVFTGSANKDTQEIEMYTPGHRPPPPSLPENRNNRKSIGGDDGWEIIEF